MSGWDWFRTQSKVSNTLGAFGGFISPCDFTHLAGRRRLILTGVAQNSLVTRTKQTGRPHPTIDICFVAAHVRGLVQDPTKVAKRLWGLWGGYITLPPLHTMRGQLWGLILTGVALLWHGLSDQTNGSPAANKRRILLLHMWPNTSGVFGGVTSPCRFTFSGGLVGA